MRAMSFPLCCTGFIVGGFGQSAVAEGQFDANSINATYSSVKEYIVQAVKRAPRHAFVCCTSNNEQVILNEVLRDLGFESSTWMSKLKHPETKVRLWWKHIPTFLEEQDDGKFKESST